MDKMEKRIVRVRITDDERKDITSRLIAARNTEQVIEDEKRAANASFKARAEAATLEGDECARLLTDGYRLEARECPVYLDKPETGRKTLLHPDTGETIAIERMTDADRQLLLPEESAAPSDETEETVPPPPLPARTPAAPHNDEIQD